MSYTTSKNAETTRPIFLYRINISDTPAVSGEEDLYLTSYDETVSYFETNSAVHSARDYTPFPIQHSSLVSALDDQIPQVTLTVSNVNRVMVAYIMNRNGLRGRTVTIRQVFYDDLADNTAYREWVYYIDRVNRINESIAEFVLLSPCFRATKQVPARTFSRDTCQHTFKGCGCWVNSGTEIAPSYTQPSTFSDNPLLFSSIIEGTGASTVNVSTLFPTKSIPFLDQSTDQIQLDIKADVPGNINTATGQLELGSGGQADVNEWALLNPLSTVSVSTSWQTFTFDLADFVVVSGDAPNKTGLNWLRLYVTVTGTTLISIRNVYIILNNVPLDSNGDRLCRKTFTDCDSFNNTTRFGGFPNVPKNTNFFRS